MYFCKLHTANFETHYFILGKTYLHFNNYQQTQGKYKHIILITIKINHLSIPDSECNTDDTTERIWILFRT
jgi:hypothetical protein